MCLKHALWHTGSVVKVLDMGLAYQLVQIDTAGLIPHENNGMVSRQFLNGVRGNLSLLIQLVYIRNISFPAHSHEFLEKYVPYTLRHQLHDGDDPGKRQLPWQRYPA